MPDLKEDGFPTTIFFDECVGQKIISQATPLGVQTRSFCNKRGKRLWGWLEHESLLWEEIIKKERLRDGKSSRKKNTRKKGNVWSDKNLLLFMEAYQKLYGHRCVFVTADRKFAMASGWKPQSDIFLVILPRYQTEYKKKRPLLIAFLKDFLSAFAEDRLATFCPQKSEVYFSHEMRCVELVVS